MRAEKKVQQKIDRRFKIIIVPHPGGSQALLGQDTLCESPSDSTETPMVEAMGNELRDPVELDPLRDPAELQVRSATAEPDNRVKILPAINFNRRETVTKGLVGEQLDTTSSSSKNEPMGPVELDASPVCRSSPTTPSLGPRQKEEL